MNTLIRERRGSVIRVMLLATTALGAGMPALADSGTPCVMSGTACAVSETGAAAAPANGQGGYGGPGNAPADVDMTLDTPYDYNSGQDGVSAITLALQGSAGAPGNSNGDQNANYGQGGNGGQGGGGGNITLDIDSAASGDDGTVITGTSTGVASALTVYSAAGDGGGSGLGVDDGGSVGTAGQGGDGGTLNLTVGGQFDSTQWRGADIWSQGGDGGGGASGTHVENKFGGDGASGGDGGQVTVTIDGYYQGQTAGIHVQSSGGDGGTGGDGDSDWSGQGGNGGTGGNGQNVDVTLASGGSAIGYGTNQAGLWVQSLGGSGGVGGGGEIGGDGGQGGNAGAVTVQVDGTVKTAGGSASPGVLAQSLGNVGGNGGHAADWSFNPTSGDGNNGGISNTVTVTGTDATIQTGVDLGDSDTAPGVLAQSVGGSGGVGPSSKGWFAVGGAGGSGSNGDNVSVSMTDSSVLTYGSGSSGLSAQSIGGGGGAGGDATGSGVLINMVIGGTGGGGGTAGDSFAANLDSGEINTQGDHAAGLVMQSIGGGGGQGGAAYGTTKSQMYGAGISVGGNGGSGGAGGTVNAANIENNSGRIITSGSDSYGILAQSIGGGGGSGGASTAKSVVKANSQTEKPLSLSLALATGGSGATGGAANTVFLTTSGLIATTGNGSAGVVGQAIGGGGGSGGDASASSSATGSTFNLSASVAHGGSGKGGGNGGDVSMSNNGLIITTGESADGVTLQSIGGGGGSGGSGDAKSDGGSTGLSLALAMGGSAAAGGEGFSVNATNNGSIVTLGDGAHGITAQTIGGGGGRAGGAAASSNGAISAQVAIGGTGGNGGDTYYNGSNSNVNNDGSILTFGADSTGILAQSIGGGGGAGGKAGTTMGKSNSNNDGSNGSSDSVSGTVASVVNDFATNGAGAAAKYKDMGTLLSTANQLLGFGGSLSDDDDLGDDLDDTSGSGGETDDDNKTTSTAIGVSIGGKGGSGGAAGYFAVTNSGTVATMGAHSDAILVQAIGGGGGKGGAASTATSADISGSIAVGGSANGKAINANNGGRPTVHNSGDIYTMGAISAGIVAQSIGGGGGVGGSSTASSSDPSLAATDGFGAASGKSIALDISVGGTGGANGISETAEVDNSGAIETRGHDSIGIIAQSIAGGGGIVKTLATDLDSAGGSANASSSKDFAANIKLGGNGENLSDNNNSGAVFVSTTTGGTITTKGDNAYGILAQSIAGGGGLALGGKPNGSNASDFLGSGKKAGYVNPGLSEDKDDNQGVHVSVGDDITTGGNGAVGVFAQSIGGSGGLAGDTGWTMEKFTMGRSSNYSGNGADMEIGLDAGATISTTGGNAPAIIAQSVGGGGGWIANQNGAYIGSAGGTGIGGLVNVMVDGAVTTTGYASVGVFAQSTGGADNGGVGTGHAINVTVGSSGSITVGQADQPTPYTGDGSAIYIANGGTTAGSNYNTVTNNGTVQTYGTERNAVAVYSTGGYTEVINNGTMNGDVLLTNGNGSGCFSNAGNYGGGDTVTVGACPVTNTGTIEAGDAGETSDLTIDGDYEGSGRLVLDADFARGKADRLIVTGDARIADEIEIRPAVMHQGSAEIARINGSLNRDEALRSADAPLFQYDLAEADGRISVTPKATFSGASADLGRNRRAVADHLQSLWDGGESFDAGFTALASIDTDAVGSTLDQVSGQALGLIGASRYQTSLGFAGALFDSCGGLEIGGQPCGWGKLVGIWGDQDASGDALGYSSRSSGVQFGGEISLASGGALGLALGYEDSSADADGGTGSVDGKAALVGLYGKWEIGDWRLGAAADFGYGWFDTSRRIAFGGLDDEATGSTNGWNTGVHARTAWHREVGIAYVEPRLDFGLVHVRTDGFQEQGSSPFNLDVDSASDTVAYAVPAIAAGTAFAAGEGATLRLTGDLGYSFLSNDSWSPAASLVSGAGDFSAETPVPDRFWTLGLGADLVTAGNITVAARYSAAFGSDYRSNGAEVRFEYRF